MLIQPYLFFDGRCEQAVEFYRRALDADVQMLMRYKDSPEQPAAMPPGMEDKVMHVSFTIGESVVMASDDFTRTSMRCEGFSLSLTVADPAEAERRFNALAEGGEIKMPLGPTFYSPSFGMLTDRFGVSWMVIVPQ